MHLSVKICGVRTPDDIAVARQGGARFVGFNFCPSSPRAIAPEMAPDLVRQVPTGLRSVGVLADPDDALLQRLLARTPLDALQLHGEETPERVAAIKAQHGLPVIKAVAMNGPESAAIARGYEAVADYLLFDTKVAGAPESKAGGSGQCFDWTLLRGQKFNLPWFLAGGLNAENLREAVLTTGAMAVDVASGVESVAGQKDHNKIKDFLAVAATL